MPQSPKLVILFAITIFIQLLILDITKYYNVLIDIFSGKRKMRYLDIILCLILSPTVIFMYIEERLLTYDLIIKRIHNSKLYKWLKTEINIKNKG